MQAKVEGTQWGRSGELVFPNGGSLNVGPGEPGAAEWMRPLGDYKSQCYAQDWPCACHRLGTPFMSRPLFANTGTHTCGACHAPRPWASMAPSAHHFSASLSRALVMLGTHNTSGQPHAAHIPIGR